MEQDSALAVAKTRTFVRDERVTSGKVELVLLLRKIVPPG